MLLVTRLIEHFLATEYQDFTEKLIIALTLPKLADFDEDNIKTLKFIEQNTHEDIMVSLYKLDRAVNKTKGDFKTITNKRRFLRNDWKKRKALQEDEYIELDEDKIQYYLCNAIREVNQIVFDNIKIYDEDFAMPQEDDEEYDELDIKKVT